VVGCRGGRDWGDGSLGWEFGGFFWGVCDAVGLARGLQLVFVHADRRAEWRMYT